MMEPAHGRAVEEKSVKYTLNKPKNKNLEKFVCAHYLRNYDEYLDGYRDKAFTLLELGIAEGASLYYWRDRFPAAKVIGVDVLETDIEDDSGRIHTYVGNQQDQELLNRIAEECAPNGFDVIIDDASHIGHYARQSFWHLFVNHLKPGGYYFIEDWGTAYWDMYPDGRSYTPKPVRQTWLESVLARIDASPAFNSRVTRSVFMNKVMNRLRRLAMKKTFRSHQRGMVGFIKELVDECGAADMTDDRYGNPPKRTSLIDWMRISVGHVIVKRK